MKYVRFTGVPVKDSDRISRRREALFLVEDNFQKPSIVSEFRPGNAKLREAVEVKLAWRQLEKKAYPRGATFISKMTPFVLGDTTRFDSILTFALCFADGV